jgi:hypothetical protein
MGSFAQLLVGLWLSALCVFVPAGSSMLESLNQPFPRALSHPAALVQQKYALTGMQVSSSDL